MKGKALVLDGAFQPAVAQRLLSDLRATQPLFKQEKQIVFIYVGAGGGGEGRTEYLSGR